MATVLVVDDESRMISTLRRIFASRGIEVEGALTGRDALRLTESREYDAVILDRWLPGEDGIDVCEALRAAGFHAGIAMLSGCGEEAIKVRAFEAGADDYIVKPPPTKEFVARIKRLLARFAPPTQTVQPRLVLPEGERAVWVRGCRVGLTHDQEQILKALVDAAGKPCARSDLIKLVQLASDNALKMAISRLRKRIGKHGLNIETVPKLGFRLK
jgi:two-component system response regulator MprA